MCIYNILNYATMNKVVDDNVQINCNQINTNTKNKNKKAKDPSETSDDISILDDKLSEAIVNKLHIKDIISNLTNGTSDHSKEESSIDANDITEAQGTELTSVSEGAINVNSVQFSDTNSHQGNEKISLPSNLVRCNDEGNIEVINSSISFQDESTQDEIEIISYESELQMPEIMRLIQKDLSEPYSIYTYRYFIHNWPKLCFLATHEGVCIGAIVCKLDMHRNVVKRGYIAMLAVDKKYRKRGIGSKLVRKAIQAMINDNADEVVLETEITNKPALKLYENLGFVRDKRLFRYYLNGVDALRLKLWLR
ncbi:N-alpha-acetyltransferase 30-like [Achroia grisella]|uniref:N-alpha-acetyltransferase 30-like n=1 Tax=Achroia grisella TaxID=688607 RepID=UPI0027D29DE5|nr:N-alpha-acetyltransferase 30-like [Achroia grisella]